MFKGQSKMTEKVYINKLKRDILKKIYKSDN